MTHLERLLCDHLRQQLNGKPGRAPDAGQDLLTIFAQLSEARTWHAHGPNPVSFADIAAWVRLMQVPLAPAHVGIIRALDVVWCEDFYRKRDRGKDMKSLPPISQQPLTADLLDAMMG